MFIEHMLGVTHCTVWCNRSNPLLLDSISVVALYNFTDIEVFAIPVTLKIENNPE